MYKYPADEVSVASYSFHNLLKEKMIDVYGYLESLVYRYHLHLADIWNGFLENMDEDDFKKIRRAMDERGVTLQSLCVDGAHPWDEDREIREQHHIYAEKMLRCAEILGAKTMRIDLGVREDDITEEQFEYTAEKFAAYAKRGAECGFVIGPENHWGASRRLAVQQRLFREINSPGYGMLLHLHNWNLAGSETAQGNDEIAAPMAVHTHVDYECGRQAGELLPRLRDAGYKGVWSCEHGRGTDEYYGVAAHVGNILYAVSSK